MFTWLNRRWHLVREEGERGSALMLVIGIAAVLTIVVATGLSLAQSATIKSGSDRDSAAAVAAAYSGIADYSARLTNDNSYINRGDAHAPFSVHSTGLTLPPTLNPAFCYGQSGGGCTPNTWAPVPGAAGNEAFRYEVDNSQYNKTGTVQLLATGRAGQTTRSIRATVRQNGFLQYVYFSDFETMDPALLAPKTGHDWSVECARYQFTDAATNPTPRNTDNCGGLIQFSSHESINGPIHSNDTLLICGGTFTDEIETGNPKPAPNNYLTGNSSSTCNGTYTTPVFKNKPPQSVTQMGMPKDNTEMVADTSSHDPNPGCIYTGPTAITFNSDGTMTVVSPWTRSTYSDIAQAATDTGRAAMCGTPGAGGLGAPRSAANPTGGQTLPVPAQNLIYVQSVPTGSSDPNYSSTTMTQSLGANSCKESDTGKNNLGYPWTSTNNSSSYMGGATYPTASAPANGKSTETVTQFNGNNYYNCASGDAFITGTVKGQVTVAASHYVYTTGDLNYATANDILGIDGQAAIWVWNPTFGCTDLSHTGSYSNVVYNTTNDLINAESTSGCQADLPQNGRTINAAMLSVNDTFQVQNYNLVGDGSEALTVNGAIVQRFRGTVGTVNSTGFTKHYSYDQRLKNISPPRFQNAVAAPWSAIQYSAAQPAYNADGSVH
ncbi:hypothetical protein GCM10022286_16330 [Gryllotalpicola daejeonensis]|uniref:Flp pilus-assembly TadG-like N-terminal domain-containing protein n=1 Tax=Gryllotalpicola daejeonensis TaxID=993087 RepID=A0ABP7ZJM6_9MICO